MPANSFAVLGDDDDESSVEEVEVPSSFSSKAASKVSAAPVVASTTASSSAPAQSGGNQFYYRSDPITGVSMGEGGSSGSSNNGDALNDLEISSTELETCIRVIERLGGNLHMFKLPQLRPLRAALHPLIMKQMENYEDGNGNGNSNNNKRDRNRGSKRKADVNATSGGSGAGGGDTQSLAEWQRLGKQKLEQMEEEYINQTQLRALRLRQVRIVPPFSPLYAEPVMFLTKQHEKIDAMLYLLSLLSLSCSFPNSSLSSSTHWDSRLVCPMVPLSAMAPLPAPTALCSGR